MEQCMPAYDIETCDGRWWMIHIPALDGLTQARYEGEIEDMARSYIALVTETPIAHLRINRSPQDVATTRRPARSLALQGRCSASP